MIHPRDTLTRHAPTWEPTDTSDATCLRCDKPWPCTLATTALRQADLQTLAWHAHLNNARRRIAPQTDTAMLEDLAAELQEAREALHHLHTLPQPDPDNPNPSPEYLSALDHYETELADVAIVAIAALAARNVTSQIPRKLAADWRRPPRTRTAN